MSDDPTPEEEEREPITLDIHDGVIEMSDDREARDGSD